MHRILEVLMFPAILGSALFLLEQVLILLDGKKPIPSMFAFIYLITFFVLAIVPIAIVSLLKRFIKGASLQKIILIFGFCYNLFSIGLLIYSYLLGMLNVRGFAKSMLLVILCLTLFILIFRWNTRQVWTDRRRRIVLGSLCIIILLWSCTGPEINLQHILEHIGKVHLAYPYWFSANALFLSLLLVVMYQMRPRILFSLKITLGILISLAISLLANHFVGDRVLSFSRRFTAENVKKSAILPNNENENVIFIVWDTVRRDHLSLYGYQRAKTSHLEALARQSVVYTDAVSVSPWTVPSHASMFTGKYPRSHGAHRFISPDGQGNIRDWHDLPGELTTLAEILKDNGYVCGSVCANFMLSESNFDQGFDYFYYSDNPLYLRFGLRSYFIDNLLDFAVLHPWIPYRLYFPYLVSNLTAEQVNDLALEWVDSLNNQRPFFLFLNYMDAHEPYYPPYYLSKRFPGYQKDLAHESLKRVWMDMIDTRSIRKRERAHLNSQYDALLVYLDKQLGALLEGLHQRGLFESSFIVFTSDHGEFLGEHDLLGHPMDLYSEVLEIPLVIKYPYQKLSTTNELRFENRALFNLVLKQVGIGKPTEKHSWTAAAELYRNSSSFFRNQQGDRVALFFDQFKFIKSSDGEDELFNLADDPGEVTNLITENPEISFKGEIILDEFFNSISRREENTEENLRRIEQEEVVKLKALGYIQ